MSYPVIKIKITQELSYTVEKLDACILTPSCESSHKSKFKDEILKEKTTGF